MSKEGLKDTNQNLLETMLKGIKRGLKGIILTKEETSITGVAHMEDIRAPLFKDLPGFLPKEEALTIKDPLHLLLPQVALKRKVPRSQL
jgi:hypothetical protein